MIDDLEKTKPMLMPSAEQANGIEEDIAYVRTMTARACETLDDFVDKLEKSWRVRARNERSNKPVG